MPPPDPTPGGGWDFFTDPNVTKTLLRVLVAAAVVAAALVAAAVVAAAYFVYLATR
jgi:hypothetical protein